MYKPMHFVNMITDRSDLFPLILKCAVTVSKSLIFVIVL